MSEDKYKELYNLALKVYDEQHERFVNHLDKASKYLSILTIIIGLYGYYIKWLIDKISIQTTTTECLELTVILLSLLLLVFLIITWFLLLSVMKVRKLAVLPLTDETIKFYYDNKLIDIYYTMSKGIKSAVENNNPILDKLSNNLAKSYTLLTIDSIIFLLITGLYIFSSLNMKGF